MSAVRKWYIGVYGGEAQARPCSPAEFEIIRDSDRRYFVAEGDFDRVTAELDAALEELKTEKIGLQYRLEVMTDDRDALQQRLTAADERVDVLTSALEGMLEYFPEGHSDGECFSVERAKAALKPAEGGGDGL